MASLSLPFLSFDRAAIIMMDDGVCVHKMSGSTVSFVGAVLWRSSDFELKLAEIIERSSVSSVVILNDAVEQHYRKEKIVIPTSLDRANIIKRRLNVAFPNYPMRSAVILKESTALSKAQAGKDAEPGDVYLFAAAPSTESFGRVIRSIARTDCNIVGYGLLPVESCGMVREMSRKLAQKWGGASGATWTILIGQHRGGGLRQIVVRGTELALTRVTPVDEPSGGGGDAWAADVFNELQATLGYLSRFGYAPEDGLNIVVIGDRDHSAVIEDMVSVPCNFEALTPGEAAKLLKIKLAKGEGDHFADALHAAWAGRKTTLTLPLTAKEISDVAGPRRAASIAMLLLSVGFGVASYYASSEAVRYYQDTKNLEVAKIRQADIERIYQEELKRKESMGIDVNLIKAALDIDSRVRRQRIDVLGVLKDVSRDLDNLRMDGFEFKNDGDVLWSGASPDEPSPVRGAKFILKFSFAGNVNPKDGNKEMFELSDRLSERLTPMGYRVRVSQPLQNLTYTGEVDKEVGLTANRRALSDRYSAEISIQKVENVKSSGN